MNVLRVIGSMSPATGGPCQGIRNIIPELEKLGLYNEVVSLDDPAAPFLGQDSFPIHPLGPAKGPWCYSEKLIPWLLQSLDRFDVVIVHGLWLYHSYGVMKALQQYKNQLSLGQRPGKVPRHYLMPHGMLDPYFQRAPERKLKAIRNWLYWKLIESKVISEADGLLFTCEAELLLARESFRPYSPKQERNVGYGVIQPPHFKPEMRRAFLKNCPELEEGSYLLFLSRIHKKKGVDLLIQAYSELFEQLSQENKQVPRLVIAGPGLETTYGSKIQQLLQKKTQLQKMVFFPGMLSGEAKWGAFYGCEAFVLPSHQENFGIAVVEALACGKPVLISNQVNIWREIEEDGGGMVGVDSLEGTRQMLKSWFETGAEQKQLIARRARESFLKKFGISPAAKQLSTLLFFQDSGMLSV